MDRGLRTVVAERLGVQVLTADVDGEVGRIAAQILAEMVDFIVLKEGRGERRGERRGMEKGSEFESENEVHVFPKHKMKKLPLRGHLRSNRSHLAVDDVPQQVV